MKQASVLFIVIAASVFTSSGFIDCLKVLFEKASADYSNPKYMNGLKFYIHRYGRKSPYYLNIEGNILEEWNTNVTFHAICYQYLNNEYRRSFVEMHYNWCDLVNKDILIGPMLRATGLKCPLTPIKYILHNLTVPSEQLPIIWPFEKSKVKIEINKTSNLETIARGTVYVKFIKNVKK